MAWPVCHAVKDDRKALILSKDDNISYREARWIPYNLHIGYPTVLRYNKGKSDASEVFRWFFCYLWHLTFPNYCTTSSEYDLAIAVVRTILESPATVLSCVQIPMKISQSIPY